MPPDPAPEIARPDSEVELARLLADASRQGRKVAPRGGGTKSDWGVPPERIALVLSTLNLNRVLEHAAGDMTATVEAGCTIEKLQKELALRGQRLAIDPLWPGRATVGGVLATNDNGSLRHAFGGLRDLIIGVTVALPDGTLACSGGKVVKNVAGYDLPKLMVGAFGTLGVITRATFRLHPLPRRTHGMVFIAPDYSAAGRVVRALRDSNLAMTGLQVRADDHAPPVLVPVRLEGSPEAVDAQTNTLHEIAGRCGCFADTFGPVWKERERLFDEAGEAAVCKVSVPSDLVAKWCEGVGGLMRQGGAGWSACVEGMGVGCVRVAGSAGLSLDCALDAVRREATALGGSLVVLQCPADVKQQIDVWGYDGDALPIMNQVKLQFDPSNTLNPGRFVGGI